MTTFHIAQVNVARAKADMDSEVMKGFVERLDEINALAERSDGFVWRLKGDEGNAIALNVFEDSRLIVNMSVWRSLESLKQYVYKSLHVELIRDREAWFDKLGEAHQALWWIPAGHIPSVEEAKEKLLLIRTHGPTEAAFNFAKNRPAPSLTHS